MKHVLNENQTCVQHEWNSNNVEWIQHTNTQMNTIVLKTLRALPTFDLTIVHK